MFAELFSTGPGRVAPTEASPEERFPILEEALRSQSKRRRKLALKAADEGLEASHFTRAAGAEYQGLRVVPKLWQPKTYGELFDAYRRVWKLLLNSLERLEYAEQQDAVSILLKRARGITRHQNLSDMVVDTLSALGTKEFVDKKLVIESVVRILHYDGKELPTELRRRWEGLRESLIGNDFPSLMQRYVAMDLLEDKFDDRGGYVEGKTDARIESLARTVLERPKLLDAELSWLLTSAAKNGYRFGYALGRADADFSMLPRLLQAQRVPREEESVYFLGGYFRALRERDSEGWESKLDELGGDEQLQRWVPELTWRSGMSERSATRMIALAEDGKVPASALRMFAFGGALRNVSAEIVRRWISFLLRTGDFEGVSIALELFHFYYHDKSGEAPRDLAVKILTAPAFFQKSERRQRTDMVTYEWAELAKTVIRQHPDAVAQIGDMMLRHLGEDGTIVEGFYSQAHDVLDEIMKAKPREMWKAIMKYLGPPIDGRAYHITSWLRGDMVNGEVEGVLSLVPLEDLWRWVDEDVQKRAWYLAGFVPKVLSHAPELVCLVREVLIRYGRRKDVRENLIANFSSEGWTGPESTHYQMKKARLLAFRQKESHVNVKRWIDEYVEALDRQIARAKVEEERRHF